MLLSANRRPILLQEYRDRSGRCTAILFKSIGVSGRCDSQKNPRVRKIRVRNSGAGKWLRQFYGHLEKCFLSAGKPYVHKIPCFRGGGILGLGGGGEVPILFLWARGFF